MNITARRGSRTEIVYPSSWEEAAAQTVMQFLLFGEGVVSNRLVWSQWSLVCRSWNSVITSERSTAAERLICDSAISLRIKLWRLVLGVPERGDISEFSSLLLEGSYSSWCEISRDSRRTYAPFLRKRPDLHLQLTRILHALASRFRDVGYCQGMNFVAGTVLLALKSRDDASVLVALPRDPLSDDDQELGSSSPRGSANAPDSFMAVIQGGPSSSADELLAFKICERIFLRNHFVRMYELGLHTRLTIWTFDKLVESLFPELHEIITREFQVSADFYASSWFITLFSADLDFYSSVRILDLFVAKGPKSLHRFGLACIASQLERLVGEEGILDPAEGLKRLRAVAATAVREHGIETLIYRSVTEFKCVTNRMVVDLQTAGKVHGGAQLLVFTDQDRKTKSWTVVPVQKGDSSPSGTALGAAWTKEEASIKISSSGAAPGGFLLPGKFMNRILFRRRRISATTAAPEVLQVEEEVVDEDDGSLHLTGAAGSSPERKNTDLRKGGRASRAFKSIRKKLLGSIMPHGGQKVSYSKTAALDEN